MHDSNEKLTNEGHLTNSFAPMAGLINEDSHGQASEGAGSISSNRGISLSNQGSPAGTASTEHNSEAEHTNTFRFRSLISERLAHVATNITSQINPARLLFPLLFVLVFLVIFQTAPLINSFDGNHYKSHKSPQHVRFLGKYKGYDDSAIGALGGSFPGISRIPFGLSYNITVLSVPPNSVSESLESQIEDFSIQPLTTVTAIPALFGRSLDNSVISLLMVLNGIDGCDPFHVPFPDMPFGSTLAGAKPQDDADLTKRKQWKMVTPPNGVGQREYLGEDIEEEFDDDLSELPPLLDYDLLPWVAVFTRGGCPFDVKIYNAQLAGFSGAIVYNHPTATKRKDAPFEDLPVRMSSNTLGENVDILAMFVTQRVSQLLRKFAIPIVDEKGKGRHSMLVAALHPSNMLWTGDQIDFPFNGSFMFLALSNYDLAVVSLLLFSASCALLWLVLLLGRNAILYAHAGALEHARNRKPPTLEKVDFPLRIITEADLAPNDDLEKGKLASETEYGSCAIFPTSRDCCAICIDEFAVGNQVRQLPCRHQFHDTCVDPWLMKHNRLCPICKQDVLSTGSLDKKKRSLTEAVATANPPQPNL
ncbi:hypothetical protein BJ742DRAFT_788508 [Cladochytrium replicatum]|nr:hypothetical protein BJ742DRAFT_788508 [Cladochytrium replicatum]